MRSLLSGLIIMLVCLSANSMYGQSFLKREAGHPMTFKEMQRQFNEWAGHTDLKNTRHWKYFKRWENEMQMHTDAQGEPGDPAIYINEAIKAAEEKNTGDTRSFLTASWSPTGPYAIPENLSGYAENGIGRINCIAFHPTNAQTFFVGVAQGGVWKTTNGGTSWAPLTDNLPIIRVSDIAIDPANTNTMYISLCDYEYIGVALNLDGRKRNTHYGLGVYKTTNGGLNWLPTGLSFQLTNGDASLIRKVLVDPANSNHLIACGASGMYTSANGGTSWTHTMDSLFWDLLPDPVVPGTLYAASGWVAAANKGYAAIYKSTDFGSTWTMLNTGIPGTGTVQRIKLAIAPSDHNYIYAMAVDINNGSYGVYKSINAGTTWQYINPGINMLEGGDGTASGGQGNYDLGFLVNATDKNKVYVGGVNIYASVDGALTFNPVSHWTLQYGPTVHADIHFLETQPSTGNIFVCSDGGLYKTTQIIPETWADANNAIPWPTQWTRISDGLVITCFYRISSSRNAIGRLIGGAQDNGSFYFDGTMWHSVFGGDGMDNWLNPADNNALLGSSQYGSFYSSGDGGVNWGVANANINGESGEWTSPLVANYNQPGTLYAGFQNVYKSTDAGTNWSALTPLPAGPVFNNQISALAVAYTNNNVIYAGRRVRYEISSPASMFKTANGGTSWTNITAGLPDSLYYTSIDVSQTNANQVYVSMAGFSAGRKMFMSSNGGTTWQNISANLPNIPVNCVKSVPGYTGIFIGTDLGVYYYNPTGGTWTSISQGLPNVIISDIEYNVVLNKLYAATFGRGIWETDLSTIIGIPGQPDQNMQITLYPTVNDGSFTIKLPDSKFAGEHLQFEVIDITGKQVYKSILAGQATYMQQLKLPPGMYFARIKGKELSGVRRFVIQ